MSLRVWLPLINNLENQGLSDLTFSLRDSTYTQVNASGKIGSCYENTSYTGGGIVSDKMINLGSKQSMCCWINMNSVYSSSSLMGIGGQHRFSTNTGMGLTIRYVSATTGYLSVNTGDGSSRTYNKYYGSTLLTAGNWYHVCYTYDGSEVKLYVNGNLDGTHTVGTLSVPAEYVSVFMWSYNHNNYMFDGKINDFRCYDHVLSPAEVKEISKGLVLHYPLNREGFGQDNIIPGSFDEEKQFTYPSSSYKDWFAPITTIVPDGSQYTLSFYAKSTNSGDKIRTHYYSPNTTTTCVSSQGVTKTASDGNMDFTLSAKWERYWVTYTQTSTTAVKHVICPRLVSGQGTGIVSIKCVKLEEGSVATPWIPNSSDPLYSAMGLDDGIEYDCSGFKNNGQWYAYDSNGSVEFSSDTPRYKISTHIVSDNATTNTASGTRYLYGHCSITEPTEMSVAFWCNPIEGYNSSTGQGQFCTTKYAYGNANVGSDYRDSAMNHRDTAIDINESTSTTQCRPTITFTANEWHHYAVTYDGQTGRVYKDGVQTSTAAFSSEKTLDSFIGVVIGFSKAGGVWRSNNSYYSDFRVYVTALSADDIVDLYQKSASIANNGTVLTYEFEEA